jgi:hypothetical protein
MAFLYETAQYSLQNGEKCGMQTKKLMDNFYHRQKNTIFAG